MARLVMAAGRWLAAVGILSAFAACRPDQVNENAYPADYRKAIIKALTMTLDDATNLRSAGISDPVLRESGGVMRYTSCVRFNPRNWNHDYTGMTQRVAYFYAGELNQIVPVTPDECSWAQYKPFPEAEKICMGERCD
jgi:hypothetical protein